MALLFLVIAAIVGMTSADGEQAADPYAGYAQERNPGYHGYSAPASSSISQAFSNISPETSVRICLHHSVIEECYRSKYA